MNWNTYFTYDGEAGQLFWKERDTSEFASHKTGVAWKSGCRKKG